MKAYDENGLFLAGAPTNKKGMIDFECGSVPKQIKLVRDNKIIGMHVVADAAIIGSAIDLGDLFICVFPPAEWHIKGIVKDRMSGDPLPGLTVEVWDVDTSTSGGPYYDPLGTDLVSRSRKRPQQRDGRYCGDPGNRLRRPFPQL